MKKLRVEPWLRGPIEGIPPQLTPIAHSLMQIIEDLPASVAGLTANELNASPGGAASVAFHLKHLPGSLDRLYTYARGHKLSDEQFERIEKEKKRDERSVHDLVAECIIVLQRAFNQLRETRVESLHEIRHVGRAQLPSNTLALLYHGAEHAQRHLGAILATAKIIRGQSNR